MRSLLGDGCDIQPIPDEVEDLQVAHLLSLIREDFPFELNTWRGGVKATDARQGKGVGVYNEAGPAAGEGERTGEEGHPSTQNSQFSESGRLPVDGVGVDHIVRVAADAVVAQAYPMLEGYAVNIKSQFGREIAAYTSEMRGQIQCIEEKLNQMGNVLTTIAHPRGTNSSPAFGGSPSSWRNNEGLCGGRYW